MSSSTYSSRISPDDGARRIVLAVAAGLSAAGLVSIALLPFAWPARAGLAAVWLLASALRSYYYRQSLSKASGYEILADGSVRVLGGAGRSYAARIAPGTTIAGRFAWLRFRSAGAGTWGELVIGPRGVDKQLKNKDWRRLQVICRHLSAC